MQITELDEVTCFYMTIENTDYYPWTHFRRNGPRDWEVLMGMSWEEVSFEEAFEVAFKNYIDFEA